MIQATNEVILGIELNRNYSQLTYYHSAVREPVTLGAVSDPERFQLPMGLIRKGEKWQLWDCRMQDNAGNADLLCIPDLYERLEQGGMVSGAGQDYEPETLLAAYFELCISELKVPKKNTVLHVMVTVKELTEQWSSLIVKALEKNGIDRKRIYVQNYLSSFYYYAINQKRELWHQDVALLDYEDGEIIGYVLHIDRNTRPAIATVRQAASQRVDDSVRAGLGESEWKKEKDRLFFELLKKVFERREISASYLVGDFFEKSWAERSIQYLCHRRHAFQGGNLYSKGACYAAMERAGVIAGHDMIFGGQDMIDRNLGMEMCIRGKSTFYSLITAGVNWYEAHHTCEFILNSEREIRVISRPMAQGEAVVHVMRLPGLPQRPNRATKLRLSVYFSSPHQCVIEAEDLGFGGFFRPSGIVWKRTLEF